MTSIVKWFDDNKGFGFINYKTNEDIFVHYSAINGNGHRTLNEGQKVSFDLFNTEKGYQAKNVSVIQ